MLDPLSQQSQPAHRHAATAQTALALLNKLANQACTPSPGAHNDSSTHPGRGITSNLESYGWIYQGTLKTIRMYILPSDNNPFLGTPSLSVHSQDASHNRRRGQGVRKNETLPYIRGEGWLEGEWDLRDLSATIRSFGARSVWDARFDGPTSSEVAILSRWDRLTHLRMKGIPPVGDTDACVVSSFALGPPGSKTAYVLSSSVKDPLVPDKGSRTTINLQGFALRSLPSCPFFESSPDASPPPLAPTTQKPVRPGHKRQQSSLSMGGLGLGVGLAPMRNLEEEETSAGSSEEEDEIAPVSMVVPARLTFPLYALNLSEAITLPTPSSSGPGIHISLVVRASPSVNLPASYLAELSNKLPLSIASLNRYLSITGFAPYIKRKTPLLELDVLEEKYDSTRGDYRVVFRVHESLKQEETRIRFHGSSFAGGRFEIEILRAKSWRIEYDVEPEGLPDVREEVTGEETGGDEWQRSARRKTKIFICASNSNCDITTHHHSRSTPSRTPPPTPRSSYLDPSRLPGPKGGMTLYLLNSSIASGPPITISITKSLTSNLAPESSSRSATNVLGLASRLVGESHGNSSIEEFLRSSTKVGRAERDLEGTKEVMNLLRRARAQEEEVGRG